MSVIKPGHVYCVAEIGINHNGDINIAKQLIQKAHAAGFDCVKFQKRTIEAVYTKEELDAPRESPWGKTNRDQKMGLEFGYADYIQIAHYCQELGIDWTLSPWDVGSVNFIKGFDVPYLKIASACATDRALIGHADGLDIPIFMSTGGCDAGMIRTISNWPVNLECLYHCCAAYPSPLEDLNISGISTLRRLCPHVPAIGYSGHETGLLPTLMAVAWGAQSIERHITLSRAMYGSDQAASLEPVGFTKLIRDIRAWEKLKGDGVLKIAPSEVPVMQKLRKIDNT